MTTAKTDLDTIREFLALPSEALPSADWADSADDDNGSVWPYLRDAVRPESRQRLNHLGFRIRLTADRDGWRDGMIVTD